MSARPFSSALISGVLSSSSPLPVPSLDEYVALASVIQYALDSNAGFRSLYRTATTLGIQVVGNLINLGKIAFAPDTPAVRDLVGRCRSTVSKPVLNRPSFGISLSAPSADVSPTTLYGHST